MNDLGKKISRVGMKWVLVVMLAAALPLCCSGKGKTEGNKDLILVLDTSMSMVGKGGGAKNIFPEVKSSLTKFISKLDVGDSLTVMTFDSNVKTYPTVKIRHAEDKEIINNYIAMVEARGLWTHTMGMLKQVFEKAQSFQKASPSRQQVIVILTDGLDDPPPGMAGEKFNLKDVGKTYSGNEWFIYLVNFGELQKNRRIAQVEKDLKGVSPHAQVINADKGPAAAIEKNLQQEVDRSMQQRALARRPFYKHPLFISLIVIAIILVVLLLYYMQSKIKVTGSLEYFNHTILNPYVEMYNMTNQFSREILVGRNSSSLNLRDFDLKQPFKIRADKVKGKIQFSILAPEGTAIQFVNREGVEYLMDGDKFKIENYTFKYIAEPQQG